MRKIFFIAALAFIFSGACKTSKKSNASQPVAATETVLGKHKGKVSHIYKETGCAAVIIVQDGSERPIILIPKDALADKFNKDNLLIQFNYRVLRMKNPEGCTSGLPAEISNVSLAK